MKTPQDDKPTDKKPYREFGLSNTMGGWRVSETPNEGCQYHVIEYDAYEKANERANYNAGKLIELEQKDVHLETWKERYKNLEEQANRIAGDLIEQQKEVERLYLANSNLSRIDFRNIGDVLMENKKLKEDLNRCEIMRDSHWNGMHEAWEERDKLLEEIVRLKEELELEKSETKVRSENNGVEKN